MGVFSNRSQKTSKSGKNITDAIGCTFTFGNALVKEISQQKKLLYNCLFYYLGITICTQPLYSQTTVILSICSLFTRMTCQSHWVPASVNTFSVLITFQCCLWSITGQTQGKMRSICYEVIDSDENRMMLKVKDVSSYCSWMGHYPVLSFLTYCINLFIQTRLRRRDLIWVTLMANFLSESDRSHKPIRKLKQLWDWHLKLYICHRQSILRLHSTVCHCWRKILIKITFK